MKRKILIILTLVLIVSLAGCSSGGKSSEEKKGDTSNGKSTMKPLPLKVTEEGYTVFGEEGLYLYYGVKIENPNKTKTADLVTLRITARDENDEVIGTEDQVFSKIYPNASIGYGGHAMNVSKMPSKVEFEIVDQEWLTGKSSYQEMASDAVNMTRDNFGMATFTGEIVNNNDEGFDSVAVSVIFRDESGAIVFGDTTYVDDVKANSQTPFSIEVFEGATDNYEVYIMPWI